MQVRLGMQVLAKNIGKLIVMYTIAYILNIFIFTLITINILLIRRHAHGAHAPSSFWCYVKIYYTIYTFTFSNSKFSY